MCIVFFFKAVALIQCSCTIRDITASYLLCADLVVHRAPLTRKACILNSTSHGKIYISFNMSMKYGAEHVKFVGNQTDLYIIFMLLIFFLFQIYHAVSKYLRLLKTFNFIKRKGGKSFFHCLSCKGLSEAHALCECCVRLQPPPSINITMKSSSTDFTPLSFCLFVELVHCVLHSTGLQMNQLTLVLEAREKNPTIN